MSRRVSLMSTLAVKAALVDTIVPRFVARTGIDVQCVFDPTNVLQQRVSHGERADLLIATRAYVNQLAQEQTVVASTARALVRTGVGVATILNADASAGRPALKTIDDLRELLLSAKSVAYSKTGASGVYFASLLDKLGIADRVNRRATIVEKGFTGECILRGDADIAIQQMSELAMIAGIKIVGPLPDDVQFYTDFHVAMFSGRAQAIHGAQLLESLFSDSARDAYERLELTVL
ncbi:molybdate ABC transporter substrate-binding protein [Paraburkholderia sp. BCC1886]|uniref:molybdate ABC transporter substrate-binding protein n=1 Tax=Paraburkholderia sp. BCC1886 TaxID=2562670 RepID=UPI001182A0C8|nr:substrate-binding domain-containing protein [Paraburkholderia sp. BCC1886]